MGDIFLQAVLLIYNTIGLQNLGISIIEIAILSRVIFYPFIKQQLVYSKKMGEMQPHIAALKEKHKDDKQGMAKAQMELFKEHGINPAAGCLPTIVQLVVLIGLFNALNSILTGNYNTNFAFWNMAKPDVFHIQGLNFALPGILVIIAALTQFIQSKMMLPMASNKPVVKDPNKKEDFATEFASAQSSMMWMFPLMFLWFGTQWPSGLALYWSVSSVIAIWQQYKISGLGGMEELWKKLMSLKK
ncbi:MAG: YidC/Oxa1 family membrane protein insertase [bacterium]|nr:YidC/Oxa1 family membrane protein insertase [bacterium]